MMNKCGGVVCSAKDGLHSTVYDLLEESLRHQFLGGSLHLVGRLDIDTEGLLIFTTDGTMTHRLTSPKSHISKKYLVTLRDTVIAENQKDIVEQFLQGITIAPEGDDGEYHCKSATLEWISENQCYLTITEGRYHQVKRMMVAVGNFVIGLKRVAMGNLLLDPSLEPGAYRELTAEEIELLG
jgi:16S rRNA pseudouridine516 synthase